MNASLLRNSGVGRLSVSFWGWLFGWVWFVLNEKLKVSRENVLLTKSMYKIFFPQVGKN